MLKNLCTIPTCYNFQKYCRIHLVVEQKTRIPIKSMSAERKEVNKVFKNISDKKRGNKTICEYRIPNVCTGLIQGFNHAAGKSSKEKLLDLENGAFCCNACNTWCEQYPTEAMALGFIKKRNTKIDRRIIK